MSKHYSLIIASLNPYAPTFPSFYGNWDDVVENQAPVVDQRKPNWSFTSAIDMYLKAGVPPKQLVAGMLPSLAPRTRHGIPIT